MNLMCNKARRPPVEETASFLQSLLNSHGSNFLEILFGPMAKNNMKKLGGVQNVAIVLSGGDIYNSDLWEISLVHSESYTIDDFSEALKLSSSDLLNLKLIFHSVEQGDLGILSAIGVKVEHQWYQLYILFILLFPRIRSSETWNSLSTNW